MAEVAGVRRAHAGMWFVLPLLLAAAANGKAEDWPEWRGKGRTGVGKETGILERFAAGGLRASWRRPIRAGFAGPAAAGGRVYLTDFERAAGSGGVERLLCLDEETGKMLWRQEWKADYRGISYRWREVDRDRGRAAGCARSGVGQDNWKGVVARPGSGRGHGLCAAGAD